MIVMGMGEKHIPDLREGDPMPGQSPAKAGIAVLISGVHQDNAGGGLISPLIHKPAAQIEHGDHPREKL